MWMLSSALGLQTLERYAPGRGLPSPGRSGQSAALRRLRKEEDSEEEGAGGRRGRAAGPIRGGRAPPSALARLLCSYLDSAARAQEFPVMPPAGPSVAQSREGGSLGRRRRRRLPGPCMSPRLSLPRPFTLCLGICLAAAATRGAAQASKFGLPPRPPLPGPCHAEVGLRPRSPSECRLRPLQPSAGHPLSRAKEGRGTGAPRAGGEGAAGRRSGPASPPPTGGVWPPR